MGNKTSGAKQPLVTNRKEDGAQPERKSSRIIQMEHRKAMDRSSQATKRTRVQLESKKGANCEPKATILEPEMTSVQG